MRLDKYIANVSELSRSDSKKVIKARKVTVDGVVVIDPRFAINETAEVALQGELLRTATPRYFMLHKPVGYVSATKDREHLTALELLDQEDNLDQLHIAGRLDIDTTGLLLITDDGQWSHRVTSPRSDCQKTYYLETVDPIDESVAALFAEGIHLDNEKRRCLPAKLELIHEQAARITLPEGKYHQVKRMLAATGNRVELLHRERIGDIILDEDLMPGEYRPLSKQEIASV